MKSQHYFQISLCHTFLGILVTLILLVFTPSLQAATLLTDNFDGASLDTKLWTEGSTSGEPAIISNGSLNLTAGGSDYHRSVILSNASNLNPFKEELTLAFTNLKITGNPGGGANSFYAILGSIDTPNIADYEPGHKPRANSSYLALVFRAKAGNSFDMVVYDGAGENANPITTVNISTIPTAIRWTVSGTENKKTWSVILTNASFADGSDTASGTFSQFNNKSKYKLAIGVWNKNLGGTEPVSGSCITLGSIEVTSAIDKPLH